jgi:hypothetical protein
MISINTHFSTISAAIWVMRKTRMGVAAVWLTAIAGAGVSRTCGFEVTHFRSKAVMASRVVAALFVEAQSTMCGRESGRMWVVLVLRQREERLDCNS